MVYERKWGAKAQKLLGKRDVPRNDTAIQAIKEMHEEIYLGEDFPLIPDISGEHLNPERFRRRYYRLLDGAGLEHRGMHSLRHTFATNLVNGIKQPNGTIISLTPKQVADILGHSTSQITEMYYVKKDTPRLGGLTDTLPCSSQRLLRIKQRKPLRNKKSAVCLYGVDALLMMQQTEGLGTGGMHGIGSQKNCIPTAEYDESKTKCLKKRAAKNG